MLDRPAVSDSQRAAHPEYYAGNVWPANPPELEPAFKALGKVVADVGLALARACDGFDLAAAAASTSSSDKIGIANLIAHSQSNKARLLHYYPQAGGSDGASDDACGVHLDHSILTGLCSAMYLDTASGAVVGPNAGAGLYIYPRGVSPRDGQAVKVSIPVDCLGTCMTAATRRPSIQLTRRSLPDWRGGRDPHRRPAARHAALRLGGAGRHGRVARDVCLLPPA